MKNIYAFTGKSPSVGYVGYISVSQHRSGEIAFSVRSEGDPAPLGIIILKPEQCEHLATNLIEFLNGEPSTIDTQRQRITELESQLAQCNEANKKLDAALKKAYPQGCYNGEVFDLWNAARKEQA